MAVERGRAAARGVERIATESVTAAHAHDGDALVRATARLGSQELERLAIVQSAVLRRILEDRYGGELEADDAKELLQGCLRSAAGWYPTLDATVLVTMLTGALGISDPAETPPTARALMAEHGSLLIDHLLDPPADPPAETPTDSLSDTAAATLHAQLTAALAEIERAETIELP